MEGLITIEQAAELIPWSVSTLRRWRLTWPDGARKGPQPHLVEGRLFYVEAEVLEWLRSQIKPPLR